MEKRLDKNFKINFKNYYVTTWEIKTIKIHILPNILKGKTKQTMKSGLLIVYIAYYKKYIFLEKSYTKFGEQTSSRSFSENKSWAYLWIISLKSYKICLHWVPKSRQGYWNILKLRCGPLSITSYKAFLKNKKRSPTSLSASFPAWSLKKNICHCLIAFTSWDVGNICIVIVCFPSCDAIIFEVNISFLIEQFFHMTKKVRAKM